MSEASNFTRSLLERYSAGIARRETMSSIYSEIERYVMPVRLSFEVDQSLSGGVQRMRRLRSSVSARSLELFASFIYSTISSPSSSSFSFHLGNDERRKITKGAAFRKWSELAAVSISEAMTNGTGTLDPCFHEAIFDIGMYGATVLVAMPSELHTRDIHFRHYPFGRCSFEEDGHGRVDTLFIDEELTEAQTAKRFPNIEKGLNTGGKSSRDAANSKRKVTYCIFPANDKGLMQHLPRALKALNRPFYSAWIDHKHNRVFDTSSFYEKPFAVARWYTAGPDGVARSPCMTALGDITALNDITDTSIRSAEKLVDPPYAATDGTLLTPFRQHAGALVHIAGDSPPTPLLAPGASRIELGEWIIQRLEDNIRAALFVPLMISDDQPVKTATQVLSEADERNRAVAPMLLRVQHELFDDLIWRVYGILRRKGVIPAPPSIVGERRIRTSYRNPVVASAKQQEALLTLRLFEGASMWGQVDPQTFDWYDTDKIAVLLHEGSGASADVLREEDEVRKIRAERAEKELADRDTAQALDGVEAQAKLLAARK